MSAARPSASSLSVQQVLLCGAMIVTLSMGIRHGFGFWLQPIITERGWTRETFSFAMAVQNLAWGFAGPFAGMLADRFGAWKILIAGGLLYALGLLLMAVSSHPLAFTLSAGVLVGIAQSGSTYAVIYGVLGRTVSDEKRSWAFGVAAAAGSFGQFVMIPVETWLIGRLGWQSALYLLAGSALLILPLALGVRERRAKGGPAGHQSIGHALREAFGYRSFQLLMLGYFVCGFQVVFIGVHLPSYLRDHGLGLGVSTGALMLIGLFNIFGTYAVGMLGQRFPKRYLLSAIYGLRSIAIVAFISLPLTPASVYVFAAVIGFLWLSTVPPTNAVVAQIFGAQHLSMLGGFVFLSHQIGSFLGVWLGGRLYDATGSYDVVWWLAVGLGVMAMLTTLPVRETAIARPMQAQPA
ncbi:MFS transporter [Roseateles saccharophilus]|uniref:Putative MFS family arabinose efflux permease n=1 Tax=Roseateles saccharophilus TaxID=304 RepID=A0A4R3VEH3_ROSSA|nr:MFS transporter [Roseateles saccharophilus]MDG0834522.1 MFS transporter [Roseateles saccharophilus]TCV03786.1 putative MFS family arabinose efflux permease [Roseateles saccharophilus]